MAKSLVPCFLNHGVYYTGSWDWEPLILPHTGCGIIVVLTAHATVVGGIARSLCKTTSCASGWCEDASFYYYAALNAPSVGHKDGESQAQ